MLTVVFYHIKITNTYVVRILNFQLIKVHIEMLKPNILSEWMGIQYVVTTSNTSVVLVNNIVTFSKQKNLILFIVPCCFTYVLRHDCLAKTRHV